METTAFSAFELRGRKALITGSSRGIGAAIAVGLAEAGADVCVHYTDNREVAETVVERIRAFGRQANIIQGDLADPDAPAAIIKKTGALDILVSNASIQIAEPWEQASREHFDQQVTVNLRAAFELIQLAAPAMIERGWGRILTIGSVQESLPHPNMTVYAATKCAQTSLVHSFAKQFAPHGVTVNNLAPGVIKTDRNAHRLVDVAYANLLRSKIPAACFGEANDCASAALLLCSDAGRYITGQSLYIDGGMSL